MIASWTYDAQRCHVLFGRGRRFEAAAELAGQRAGRCLLVASPGTLRRNDDLVQALGAATAAIFDRVEMHCPIEIAEAALARFDAAGADAVVTVGGGSAIGIGKFIRLRRAVPYIAVPTTLSGSEMTQIHGAKVGNEKRTGRDPASMPTTVLYDPEIILSLPAADVAGTGMNSLAHCFEAFYPRVPNPLAAAIASEGVAMHFAGLPRCIENPQDLEAREQALNGAFIGGLLVQQVGIGLHHQLCHVLGGRFDLAHGVSNAIALPHVVGFYEREIEQAAPALATRLGLTGLGRAVFDLARRIGAARALSDYGVPRHELGAAADETIAHLSHSPRPIDRQQLARLLEAMWEGSPPHHESSALA